MEAGRSNPHLELWIVNAGVLDRKTFCPTVENAWSGKVANMYQGGRLGGIQPVSALNMLGEHEILAKLLIINDVEKRDRTADAGLFRADPCGDGPVFRPWGIKPGFSQKAATRLSDPQPGSANAPLEGLLPWFDLTDYER